MFDFHPQLKQRFAALRTGAEFFSLRYVRESGQYLSVRKNVAEPPSLSRDEGAMLTVRVNGVEAYAATNDLSQQGLQAALERADTASWQYCRPDGVAFRFQPLINIVKPPVGNRACNLFSKDDWRAALADEVEPYGPKVPLVVFP